MTTDGMLNRVIATRITYVHNGISSINDPDEFARGKDRFTYFASLGCLD